MFHEHMLLQAVRLDFISLLAACARAHSNHAALAGLALLCDRTKIGASVEKTKETEEQLMDIDEYDDNDFFAQVFVQFNILRHQ